jgi:hypothetical protein
MRQGGWRETTHERCQSTTVCGSLVHDAREGYGQLGDSQCEQKENAVGSNGKRSRNQGSQKQLVGKG